MRDITAMIASFDEQSEIVNSRLTSLLSAVKEGRVPTAEDLNSLENCVSILQNSYDRIFNYAQETVTPQELPKDGSPVSELVSAIENSQVRYLEEQLGRTKATLTRFLAVKSLIEEYSNALRPYQEKAAALLEQLGEKTVEAIIPQVQAPELFLKALDMDDLIRNPDGLKMMKSVQDYYPDMEIYLGLIGKQFFLDPSGEKDQLDKSSEESPKDSPIAVERNLHADQPTGISSAEDDNEKSLHDLTDESSIRPIDDTNQRVVQKEEAKTANTFKVINTVKTGSPSASAFRKEIDKIARTFEEVLTILPLFTNLGVLSKAQVFGFGVFLNDFYNDDDAIKRVFSAIDVLTGKGYLAEFSDHHGNMLYCLSSYSFGCMQKESIKDKHFLKISVGAHKVFAVKEINASQATCYFNCNKLLLQYLESQRKNLSLKQLSVLASSIKWSKGHYQVVVFDRDMPQGAYLCISAEEIAKAKAQYVIIPKDLAVQTLSFNPSCKCVYVIDSESAFCCDPTEDIIKQLANGLVTTGPEDKTETPDTTEESLNNVDIKAETPEPSMVEDSEPGSTEDLDLSTTGNIANSSGEATDRTDHNVKLTASEVEISDMPVQTDVPDTTQPMRNEQNDNSVFYTPKVLMELDRMPTDSEFCQVIHQILTASVSEEELASTVVNATMLAKGAGLVEGYPESNQLSLQVCLATNLLLGEAKYSSECLLQAFGNAENDVSALALAAYMYALLTPAAKYDFGLNAQTEQYLSEYDSTFVGLSAFKPLYNTLLKIPEVKAGGFTPSAISLLGDEAESERFIASLQREAKDNLTIKTPSTNLKALPVFYNSQFGRGSDLYICMGAISEGKSDADTLEFIESVLAEYCENAPGEHSVDEYKLGEKLNTAWSAANSRSNFKLEYGAREQALRHYRQRLAIMIKWAEHFHDGLNSRRDIERLKDLRNTILCHINEIQNNDSWKQIKDSNVLKWFLIHMVDVVNGTNSNTNTYQDMIKTGVFSFTPEGVPIFDASLNEIKYYEPWRNALKHIIAPRRSLTEITDEILGETADGENGLKDNLRQLSVIGLLIENPDSAQDIYSVSADQIKEATISADDCAKKFKDELELAYTYYQINETEKETLSGIMQQYKNLFYEIGDFAAWRRFLDALRMQIREYSNGRKKSLRSRLSDKLANDPTSGLLVEAERLLEEDSNFSVTEEYLNRYESGERQIDQTALSDVDYFSDFLDENHFDPILKICQKYSGHALKSFGTSYLEQNYPKDWTTRQREDSKALVGKWSSRKDTATPAQVEALLKGLGLDVIRATKAVNWKEEMWQVMVRPIARSLADYLHPIAAFGTQTKSPLSVIFLYGNYTEKQIVDKITSMNLGSISLVFIDRPIEAKKRRHIGEIFHTQKTGQNPFLLIDQVLFLYLAMHQETERLPALLNCTLPYTTYQPFVRDGGSTADEMFCGRARELATIIDPNGACVVYGGRQLGKTALLERAESRCNKPYNKNYAVYTSIIRLKSESEVVATIVDDIRRKTDGKISLKSCVSIRDMCSQLSDLFQRGDIVSMHLLIDEVDDFLGAIAENSYKPIQPLVDLKRSTKNSFKFVIAGLHNVCRAKNATRDNGLFGQLGTPLCIKPLSPTDALQLISRPLRYLGFQIDRYPHLETILTNTNYYPGILQFFGYILVETLIGQYSKYYSAAENPPFTLRDEQLGAVMNSSDLNRSIKDKFRWSLELDQRYFMIARCITMLYHIYEEERASGGWRGFSVDEIMSVAKGYDIACLKNASKADYVVLMDEMVEMGILAKPKENVNNYRLRRNSFVDIIGEKIDNLEADIINNNREE